MRPDEDRRYDASLAVDVGGRVHPYTRLDLSAYTLTGGSGADTFVFRHGETGSDTITDFSTTDGDKIDIHDILIGFNPLTSAITDFLHVTASGSDAIVSVDADWAKQAGRPTSCRSLR